MTLNPSICQRIFLRPIGLKMRGQGAAESSPGVRRGGGGLHWLAGWRTGTFSRRSLLIWSLSSRMRYSPRLAFWISETPRATSWQKKGRGRRWGEEEALMSFGGKCKVTDGYDGPGERTEDLRLTFITGKQTSKKKLAYVSQLN